MAKRPEGRAVLGGVKSSPAALRSFTGAKVALIRGGDILTYLRDDIVSINWPGRWDLPGGGREGDEAPETCVLRELQEEFGLTFGPERLVVGRELPAMADPTRRGWIFAGQLTDAEISDIRFGDEGQFWRMMPLRDFLSHSQGIPLLQDRTRLILRAAGWL